MTALRLLLALPLLVGACDDGEAQHVAGGDWQAGFAAIERHGCRTCHRIPGVPGANGATGPPLDQLHRQAYIAGVVPNEPPALIGFMLDPQATDPRSAMPNLGLSETEARDISAYLLTAGRR